MRRTFPFIVLIVIAGGILWFFPLFHVVSLKQAQDEKTAATFNPAQFAENFWTDKLLPSLAKAVPAEKLLPAIQHDPANAKKQFAHTLGMSDSYTYFLSGTGRVIAVSDDEISLALTVGSTNDEVTLPTGLLFGNAVRDGTGLLDVNAYPNSQDFNNIAAELNHLVETRVLPGLKEHAKVGATVRFAGCAEVDDESTDLKPLHVVPIQAEVE